jgi:hypothetical protein
MMGFCNNIFFLILKQVMTAPLCLQTSSITNVDLVYIYSCLCLHLNLSLSTISILASCNCNAICYIYKLLLDMSHVDRWSYTISRVVYGLLQITLYLYGLCYSFVCEYSCKLIFVVFVIIFTIWVFLTCFCHGLCCAPFFAIRGSLRLICLWSMNGHVSAIDNTHTRCSYGGGGLHEFTFAEIAPCHKRVHW